MIRSMLFLSLAAGMSLGSSTAFGAVTVLGGGIAHECFIAAKFTPGAVSGISLCDRALNEDFLTSTDRAATYVNRGVIEAATGQADRAMEDYQRAIKLRPSLGDAYIDLGATLIARQEYDDALIQINTGISLDPASAEAGYFNRGVIEEIRGNFLDAYHDYKRALAIVPDFAPALERLKYFKIVQVPATQPGGSAATPVAQP